MISQQLEIKTGSNCENVKYAVAKNSNFGNLMSAARRNDLDGEMKEMEWYIEWYRELFVFSSLPFSGR